MYNRITMLHEIQVVANAKVNIGLYVSPKRNDGFHDIDSIFTLAPISDDLTVLFGLGENECTVQCSFVSDGGEKEFLLPENNTIVLTYNAFCKLTGFQKSVQVIIRKRIPAGGGLGGGSSDAASFLFALERLSGIVLTTEERWKIAEKVGSDVFFFLYCLYNNEKTAFVSGRGEFVKGIKSRTDLYILIVCPFVHSSTKEAYDAVDRRLEKIDVGKRKTEKELVDMYNKPISEWKFFNDFTPVMTEKYNLIAKAISDVKESGALFADMSGSGSSVFGVFDNEEALMVSYNKLRTVWTCYAQLSPI